MFDNKKDLMSFVTMVSTVSIAIILLVSALVVIPRALKSLDQLDETVSSINETMPQLLEKTDKLIDDVDGMITVIDIEGLNGAVNNLRSVVEPLAKLFGK